MDKIKHFIECIVPVTICNLKCSYCYIIQENRRTGKMPEFKYSPRSIGQALSKDRLGGTCYINICGAGETLVPKEMPEIIYEILKQGHYVNVTTNGTLSNVFKEIVKMPQECLERLHFAFSFHYLELIRTNLLETFFTNIKMIKKAGCSFVLQLNLCDDYIPYLDEIKNISLKELGAMPQVAATRNELNNEIQLLTEKTREEYTKLGNEFKSPLFDFTMKNFMVKRNEFCYAGDWTFLLNLATGDMRKCYCTNETKNIFENIKEPIKLEAIGNNCKSQYCVNSSHFMSLGVIPSIDTPTYAQLRNREEANWYNEKMKAFLNTKLCESNKRYSTIKKIKANLNYNIYRVKNKYKQLTKKRTGDK